MKNKKNIKQTNYTKDSNVEIKSYINSANIKKTRIIRPKVDLEKQYKQKVREFLKNHNELIFSDIKTNIIEFPTLDCPHCDPMSTRHKHNGIWVNINDQK